MRPDPALPTFSLASRPQQRASSCCSPWSLFRQAVVRRPIEQRRILPGSKSEHRAKRDKVDTIERTFCCFLLSITAVLWHNWAAMILMRRAERGWNNDVAHQMLV